MKKPLVLIILATFILSVAKGQSDSYRPAGFDFIGASYKTFSVSATKKVHFSRGNLQYNAVQDKWRFAPRQYTTVCSGNSNIAADYDGWIDLFGWGTSGWNSGAAAYQPWSSSNNKADYTFYGEDENPNLTGEHANSDWGVYNKISNGGNGRGMWRTLTKEEWSYLVGTNETRNQKWGMATIDGIYKGLVLLPDDWTMPEGLSFTRAYPNGYATNKYTMNEWKRMESEGAVFLPAAGQRSSRTLRYFGEEGQYWSSSSLGETSIIDALNINFKSNTFTTGARTIICMGMAVRLVRDERSARGEAFDENGASYKTFSVSENTAVRFSKGNLQYHAVKDEWRFAARQYQCLGDANANAAADYNGWIDLFGWGTSGWNNCISTCFHPWNTSSVATDYWLNGDNLTGDYVKADWGIYNKISNGGNQKGLWRVLTNDEWAYLIGDNATRSGKWGLATISGKYTGLVILPDDWTLPDGLTFTSGRGNGFTTNIYTLEQWQEMESAGALFLVAAGYRYGTTLHYIGTHGYNGERGYYSSSINSGGEYTYNLNLQTDRVTTNTYTAAGGISVRLVWNDLEVDMSNNGCDPTWVDMGLPSGNLWYSANIGASAPEEYGSYFAWGETEQKSEYGWDTYRYGTAVNALTKYCYDSEYGFNGFTDALTILQPADDAARAALGGNARMPKGEEWQELIDYCTREWTTQNGVQGYKFTSNANGNAMFLPAAGIWGINGIGDAGVYGYYWSSSIYDSTPANALGMDIGSTFCVVGDANRSSGQPVRAVKGDGVEPAFDENGSSTKRFTVAEGRTVSFSKGNLQYNAAQDTWRFAENQYDYVGNDNSNISSSYNGWIDLFGWGTSGWNSGANAYQPWATSSTNSDYYIGGNYENSLTGDYANADWGVYNAISNGGNQAGMWRTMTSDEWEYLINTRNASTVGGTNNARYAKATVNSMAGLIILPDSFTKPSGVELENINTADAAFDGNTYTISQWSVLERAGAIFLPAAGGRGTEMSYVGTGGFYWSSTYYGARYAWNMNFGDDVLGVDYDNRHIGRSVRLVKD